MGRWIGQDPLQFNAGDSNLYRYVNNAPTNATDPSGFKPDRLSPYKKGGVQIGGVDELLRDNTFPFAGGAGTVQVVTNASHDGLQGLIALKFQVQNTKDTAPVDKVHWLQFGMVQVFNRGGAEFKYTDFFDEDSVVPIKDIALYYYKTSVTNRVERYGAFHLDTLSTDPRYPFADFSNANVSSDYVRTPNQLTLFDRPSNDGWAKDDRIGKSVSTFDSFLVTDQGEVLYCVHWQASRNQGEKTQEYSDIRGFRPAGRAFLGASSLALMTGPFGQLPLVGSIPGKRMEIPSYAIGPNFVAGYKDLVNKAPQLTGPYLFQIPGN